MAEMERRENRLTEVTGQPISVLHSKSILQNMMPDKMIREDQWRRWHVSVMDYAEEVQTGLKDTLDKVRKLKAEATEHEVGTMWGMKSILYRFLKKFTGDQILRIIENVLDDNGFEAWRQLELHCEPSVGVKEAQVLMSYTNMSATRAKSPKELKKLMAEMERRENRLTEVTGQPISVLHSKSILQNMIDVDTMKHCAQYITVGTDRKEYANLKSKIIEFIDLIDSASSKPDDIKKIIGENDEETNDQLLNND